ncbi:RNA-binding S4 domain-containing protein [Nocardioides sp. BP30]|uniref:RNA-binding S4 domain-containing protein n=1 Tax=Nocardioides sp. BP30 TaxID=3036374 RepID=UPI0024690A9D|nr:RNA-binding S4 domain-containing protein [Nocardioides sp. BP30]WGL51318.1 RNA-binding S4 domain-containing protein [Nocardioides sp. BP30]
MAEPQDVPIRDESIRLGQFLKLANLVDSGADAKPVIAEGAVRVNGSVETRRGRQLHRGDVVELGGVTARVVDEATFDDGLPW